MEDGGQVDARSSWAYRHCAGSRDAAQIIQTLVLSPSIVHLASPTEARHPLHILRQPQIVSFTQICALNSP